MARSKYINTFNTTAEYDNYIESGLPEFPNVGYDKEAGVVKIMRTSPNDNLFYGELVDATQNIPEIKLYNDYAVSRRYTPTVDTLTNEFYIDDWGTVPTFNKLSDNFLTNKPNIKSIKKFKGLYTSNVTNMDNMFNGCSSLTSVDLSSLDTSNVTTMGSTFYGCKALTSLDLSNWDTSNVTNITNMFIYCSSLTSLDLSNFNTSKVTSFMNIFNGCNALTSLNLSNWDISNVTIITNMFFNTNYLKDVYITVEGTLMMLTNNLSSQGGSYIPSNNGNCTIHYNDVDYKWQNNAWTPQS